MTGPNSRFARTGMLLLAGSGLLLAFIVLARIIPAHWILAVIVIALALDRLRTAAHPATEPAEPGPQPADDPVPDDDPEPE